MYTHKTSATTLSDWFLHNWDLVSDTICGVSRKVSCRANRVLSIEKLWPFTWWESGTAKYKNLSKPGFMKWSKNETCYKSVSPSFCNARVSPTFRDTAPWALFPLEFHLNFKAKVRRIKIQLNCQSISNKMKATIKQKLNKYFQNCSETCF